MLLLWKLHERLTLERRLLPKFPNTSFHSRKLSSVPAFSPPTYIFFFFFFFFLLFLFLYLFISYSNSQSLLAHSPTDPSLILCLTTLSLWLSLSLSSCLNFLHFYRVSFSISLFYLSFYSDSSLFTSLTSYQDQLISYLNSFSTVHFL